VLIFIFRGFRVFYYDVLEELAATFIRVKGYLEPGKEGNKFLLSVNKVFYFSMIWYSKGCAVYVICLENFGCHCS
jgi:hypothetical protein